MALAFGTRVLLLLEWDVVLFVSILGLVEVKRMGLSVCVGPLACGQSPGGRCFLRLHFGFVGIASRCYTVHWGVVRREVGAGVVVNLAPEPYGSLSMIPDCVSRGGGSGM